MRTTSAAGKNDRCGGHRVGNAVWPSPGVVCVCVCRQVCGVVVCNEEVCGVVRGGVVCGVALCGGGGVVWQPAPGGAVQRGGVHFRYVVRRP